MSINENIFLLLAMVALLVVWILNMVKGKGKGSGKKLNKLKCDYPKNVCGIPFGKKGKKIIYSPVDGEQHIGIFAGTGQGKTSAIGIPMLRAWGKPKPNGKPKSNGTSFCIDISGDICKNCPQMENKIIFAPELTMSAPYNIFGAIDDLNDIDEQNEALEQLAFLLMPESANMNDNAKFFLSNGRKILTASLIAFYHQGMDFIEICELIVGNSYFDLFDRILATNNQSSIIYINSFRGASEQNTAGCKQSCDDALKLFATNAKIKNCVRRPYDYEEAVEPKLIEEFNIFVIVDDYKLELYAPLLNIIVNQLMQYISKRIVTDKSKTILVFLDEFASLRISANMIVECLRKYRKRKMRLVLATQNIADLDILYGHNVTRSILSNMKLKVLLGGLNEGESQHYFADMLGYKDTKKKSISKSSNSSSITESEAKEYVIDPAELDRLGDDMILICPDEPNGYMRLKKNFYFKK